MHILFTRFPLASAFGGAEVQTLSLMEGLRADGHDVLFLGSCPTLLQECKKRGFQVTELDIGKPPVTKWGSLSFLWRKKKMRRALIRHLQTAGKIDAVCMLSLSEKLLITDWLRERGASVFWIEHDRVGRWLRKNPWLPRLRRMSALATTVVVSDLSKRIYRDLGWEEKNLVSIPNGVDPERFTAITKKGSAHANDEATLSQATDMTQTLHVGCIARLSPEKGVDVLVTALKHLPNVRCSIVGTGPEYGRLMREITESTMAGRVTISPPPGDLSAFYRSIDILVLPSRDHDPFGLVAAEAMMIGVPVIMTDACGIAGYVSHGLDALIAPAGSADAIASAIASLQEPTARKILGENGHETAIGKFSLQAMVNSYKKLMQTSAQ